MCVRLSHITDFKMITPNLKNKYIPCERDELDGLKLYCQNAKLDQTDLFKSVCMRIPIDPMCQHSKSGFLVLS